MSHYDFILSAWSLVSAAIGVVLWFLGRLL